MAHDRRLLNRLSQVEPREWSGEVFRHILNDYHPLTENTTGARWNPPGVAALYTSLTRDTVLAEGNFILRLNNPALECDRWVYRLAVKLSSVLDLSDMEILKQMGITELDLKADDHEKCSRVGGAAAILGHDGLLVPSARDSGINLVVFPTNRDEGYVLEETAREKLPRGH